MDDYLTLDLHYSWHGPGMFGSQPEVQLSILNVGDELPPFAPSEMTYDSLAHRPFGRQLKSSFTFQIGD